MKLLVLLINCKNKIERSNNYNVLLKFQTYFYFNIETIGITASERKIVPRFEWIIYWIWQKSELKNLLRKFTSNSF